MDHQQTAAGATAAPADRAAGTAGPPPDGPPPLRRSRRHKEIAGVCGGLGRRYDIDPLVFRIVLFVLAVSGGVGLIAYGFAWLLLPLDGEDENEGRRLLSGRVEGPALTALLCALVGCGLLLSMIRNTSVLSFALMLTAAATGACVWSRRRQQAEREGVTADAATAQVVADAPPETKAPPVPGMPSWWRDPIPKDGLRPGLIGTGYLWGPDYGPYDKVEVSYRPRRVRERGWVGAWTFLFAICTAGGATIISWDRQPLGTSLEIGLACALAVFGLGLVLSAWVGRAGAGTIVAALLTCVLLAGAAVLPKSVTADWVRTEWKPATAAAVRSHYELGTGDGRLDLAKVKLRKDQTVSTRASTGVGRLRVVVPAGATVKLMVEVGLGDIRLPGEREDDIDVSPGTQRKLTLEPPDGRKARGTLDLELEAGVGQVEVFRAAS